MSGSRTPSLAEVIRIAVDDKLRRVHVSMPAKVDSYDKVRQTVDVQPMIMDVTTDEEGAEVGDSLPQITRVPVMFPRGGEYFITWPISKGDFVHLVFNERSIDQYVGKDGSEVVDPIHTHTHDLSDPVAYAGFYPFGSAISDIDDVNMVLGKDNGKSKIIIEDAAVEVRNANGATLRLDGKDASATATVGDGAVHAAVYEHLKTYIDSTLKPIIDTHIHPTGMGPSGPPVAPMPGLTANVKSGKVSFPDG